MNQKPFKLGKQGRLTCYDATAQAYPGTHLESDGQTLPVDTFVHRIIEVLVDAADRGDFSGRGVRKARSSGFFIKASPETVVALWAAEFIDREHIEKAKGSRIRNVKFEIENNGEYSVDIVVDSACSGATGEFSPR